MTTAVYLERGTPIVWADATDYSSTGSGYTRTAQIDLTSIANGAARQGDKVDFTATPAHWYEVHVGMELDVAPTAGNEIDIYFSASASGTAGTGNEGGASGADGAYQAGSEAEWVRQLTYVGSIALTNDAATTVQRKCVNPAFVPPQRYGSVIVYNRSGQALEGDAVEMYVAFVPVYPLINTA